MSMVYVVYAVFIVYVVYVVCGLCSVPGLCGVHVPAFKTGCKRESMFLITEGPQCGRFLFVLSQAKGMVLSNERVKRIGDQLINFQRCNSSGWPKAALENLSSMV